MFALSTVGCLAGNYLTGFVLIPGMTVDAIVLAVVGLLVALATTCTQIGRREVGEWGDSDRPADAAAQPSGPQEPLSPGLSYAVVFLASFAGMALELSASRMMAQVVGVSLDSWTGVIGVMLAGTAAGNWLGGRLADRPTRGRLGWWLLAAAAGCVLCLGVNALLWLAQPYLRIGLVPLILLWTGVVFLPPMLLLGTVSPQVVRLATADLATAGRTAGRVYAVSTAGAIAGTLATGFVLIRAVGMYRTVLLAAVLAAAAAVVGGRAFAGRGRRNLLAAVAAAVLVGLVAAGPVLDQLGVVAETNYYTIRVVPVGGDGPDRPLQLQLDRLIHSQVRPDDPLYLYYRHEQIQLEFLKGMGPAPRALVVGGGGYTFPRAARTVVPGSAVDVVEIDPGVTRVAYSHLGLDPALGVTSVHMDGRQFVAERAAPAGYDLITLDAVNDLSVPAHLLTVECNAAVRRALAPGGVYLVTVIDGVADGRLWKAVFHTLKAGFPHVALLSSEPLTDPDARPSRAVLVLYAADRPPAAAGHGGATHVVPDELVGRWLATDPPLVLTDQYAPVDNLMAGVFRRR
jgi:predicted membrane-bound spermidine synthase